MSRNASEVLLEIEEKMDQILGLLKNHDFLLKNLANRISEQKNSPSIPPKQVPSALKKIMPGLKPGVVLGNVKGQTIEEEIDFPQAEEIERIHSVNVQQKIVFADGKPAIAANVELTNDGEFRTVLKTNAGGKWTQSLSPGSYNVKVTKKVNGTIKPLEFSSKIEIPATTELHNLEVIKLL